MSDSKACPSCGHPNTLDARFCARCGTSLPAAAPTPAPAPARAVDANRTMLGALIDPMPKPAAAAPAAPKARENYRTVVGGGFDPLSGAPVGAVLPGVAPFVAPPASSTMGLPASPMSSPGTAIPPAVAAIQIAPAAPAPIARAPMPAPVAPAPVIPAVPSPNKHAMRTMIGVGLNPFAAGAAPGTPALATPPAALAPAPVAAAPAPLDTIAAPPPPAAPAAPFADTHVDPPKPASAAYAHRTMLGMPTPMIASVAPLTPLTGSPSAPLGATIEGPPPAPAVPPPSAPMAPPTEAAPAAAKRNIGPSNRTMLGVVAPVGRASLPASIPEMAPSSGPPTSAPAYVPTPRNPSETSSTDVSIAGMPSPRRRVRGWFFALLFLGVLLVGTVIAAGLWFRMTRQRVDVAAAVAMSSAGETLGVDVARAPDGTRARFGTVEQVLTGTHADFPLAADALRVGDNAVAVDILFADGTTETHQVTLTVEYRVRADLASLTATPPAITVVLDAVPGSTVVLDAQPLVLDAQGHGTRAYPISAITPDTTGTLALTAHYTITPPAPAVAATGTLSSRVPTTTLRMERPGDNATTDRASALISGVTQAGATVTVEGVPATVSTDGHFSYTAPLPAVGAHELHVTATLAGRAPATVVLHVERVADLARAASAFTVDRTLTYARLAPAPATFQGQHVAIEGRVYNVDLQDGHGVLQMLSRECPTGQRCPLWVTYSAVTDVTVESWVRVIGTVAGEQQFMSQSGEVRTVPRVDAAFVLPSHP